MIKKSTWHYTIYKITNLDNGIVYVGQHRTVDPGDSYMGSGSALNMAYDECRRKGQAIGSHFRKDVLFDFGTFEEMDAKEKEIVTGDFVRDPNTYNMTTGGARHARYPKGCIVIEYGGRRGSLREWSERTGLSLETIRQRYLKGIPAKEILETPPRERDRILTDSDGVSMDLRNWARILNMPYDRLAYRIRKGQTIDEVKKAPFGNAEKTYDFRGGKATLKQISAASGIRVGTIRQRIRSGMTPEQAAETPLSPRNMRRER